MAEITTDPRWQDEEPPRKSTRARWLVGIGAVVVAAAVAAAVGYSQNWGHTSRGPNAAPSASAPAHGGGGLGGTVTQDPGTGGDASRTADFKTVKFVEFHGTRLPVSPAYGPKTTTATTSSGFSHDAGGAVTAAVHLGVYASPQAGPDVYGPTLKQQATGDTSTFLSQLDSDYRQARQDSGMPDSEPLRIYTQVIGYAPLTADPTGTEVTVHLLVRGPNDSGGTIMGDFPVTLQWQSGDWRLLAPDGGQFPFNGVSTTDGYNLFPGMN